MGAGGAEHDPPVAGGCYLLNGHQLPDHGPLENGPGKWPHSLPVVFSSVPYNSGSSASRKILIQQADYFLLLYRQNTASQKYAAGRIGPRHIKRNSNICMAIIQNAADLTPVE